MKTDQFIISRTLLNDKRLPLMAKGLLLYLLGLSTKDIITIDNIYGNVIGTKKDIDKAFAVLIFYGYARKQVHHDDDRLVYTAYDTPLL